MSAFATEEQVKRDRWSRPLILPAPVEGVEQGAAVPYTRVSTLAKKLDDGFGLGLWQQRVVALGIARRPSLYRHLCALAGSVADPLKQRKQELSRLVDQAFETGGGNDAAQTGTAVHLMTELVDAGMDPNAGDLAPVIEAYRKATAGLEMVAAEQFVVCDEVQAAGTLDRLVRLPDGRVVVADVKTGANEPDYPSGVTTQCAIYARGRRYDPTTGVRGVLHPDLDVTRGLLIHLPVDGRNTCEVYELDLDAGWAQARVAATVRDLPSIKKPKTASW